MRLAIVAALLLTGCHTHKRPSAAIDGKWTCFAVKVDAKTGNEKEWHCKDEKHGKRYKVEPL